MVVGDLNAEDGDFDAMFGLIRDGTLDSLAEGDLAVCWRGVDANEDEKARNSLESIDGLFIRPPSPFPLGLIVEALKRLLLLVLLA